MTRVAYVCTDPGVPVFGCKGSSVHVQEVIRAILRAGASVHLFARRFGGELPGGLESLRWTALPPANSENAEVREESLAAMDADLPDLLAANGPFDLIYERHALWSHSAMDWARRQGCPALLEVNAPLVEEQLAHRTLRNPAAAERIARKAQRSATLLVAVSNGVAERLIGDGVPPRKIAVIGNGVDVRRFPKLPPAHGGDVTIGFVGTLKPWHGVPVLIEAVRLAKAAGVPMRLLIVGDGPERASIAALIETSGLAGTTELLGAVDPSAIPSLLARIDIAAAPYPDLPGFYFSPLKIAEYMAAGCAILASRIGDIESLLTDGETALLCESGSAESLAANIIRLHNDPGLRSRLGEAARCKAERDLGWDRVAERVLHLAAEVATC